ncbi:MAG: hypothetical protein ACYCS7_06915 [Acidimicrobiales bacterium]
MSYFSNSIDDAFGDDGRPKPDGEGPANDGRAPRTQAAMALAAQMGRGSPADPTMTSFASDMNLATGPTEFLIPDFSDLGEGGPDPIGSGSPDIGEPGIGGANDTLDWLDPPDHAWRPSDDDILPAANGKAPGAMKAPKKGLSWNMEIPLGRKSKRN